MDIDYRDTWICGEYLNFIINVPQFVTAEHNLFGYGLDIYQNITNSLCQEELEAELKILIDTIICTEMWNCRDSRKKGIFLLECHENVRPKARYNNLHSKIVL